MTDKRKWLRLVIVTGVGSFALGALAGSWLAFEMSARHRENVMRNPERVRVRFVDVLRDNLDLRPEQVEAVEGVIAARHAVMLESRKAGMAAMDAAILELLDEEQAARFGEMVEHRERYFPAVARSRQRHKLPPPSEEVSP